MTKTAVKNRRARPGEMRRDQLIQAPVRRVAKHRLSGTTMTLDPREAGLPARLANLYFERREKRQLETLESVTSEYCAGQTSIVEHTDFALTDATIEALPAFDFSPAVSGKTSSRDR